MIQQIVALNIANERRTFYSDSPRSMTLDCWQAGLLEFCLDTFEDENWVALFPSGALAYPEILMDTSH
jgi:hypothetical protein